MTPPGTYSLLGRSCRCINRWIYVVIIRFTLVVADQRVYAVIIGFPLVVSPRWGHDQCHELKGSRRGAAGQGPLGEGAVTAKP